MDDKRLEELGEKLRIIEDKKETPALGKKNLDDNESKSAMGIAFRMGIEMVSAVVVGCGLGLIIDHYFGTSPWGMIFFFFLGCGAGVSNVYKSTQKMNKTVGFSTEKND